VCVSLSPGGRRTDADGGTDLREHALLALRNLLHDNAENQAVVAAIRPMGTWDENGVLVDAPGAVRR
jgi:ataxin-10